MQQTAAFPDGAGVENAAELSRRCLGCKPDEKQEEVLRAEEWRTIVNTTPGWEKSTVAVVEALHWAWIITGAHDDAGERAAARLGGADAAGGGRSEFLEKERSVRSHIRFVDISQRAY